MNNLNSVNWGKIMQKLLVTGATGFVGSHLIKKLIALGFETHIIARKNSNLDECKALEKNVHIHIYDQSIDSMIRILKDASPDIVVHLASLFLAEHYENDVDELIKSNILFGTHLLEGVRKAEIKYLINTGTNWQNYCSNEYVPVNLYAATKEAFECIAKYYTQVTSLRMITLKLYDTYGPKDKRQKVMSLFGRIAKTGEILDMSPGNQLLGLVHIDDVVDAYLEAINLIKSKAEHDQETYYVSPNEFYSLKEVANTYETEAKVQLNINWGKRQYRTREVMKPFDEGERLPGWCPRINLKEGIISLLCEC